MHRVYRSAPFFHTFQRMLRPTGTFLALPYLCMARIFTYRRRDYSVGGFQNAKRLGLDSPVFTLRMEADKKLRPTEFASLVLWHAQSYTTRSMDCFWRPVLVLQRSNGISRNLLAHSFSVFFVREACRLMRRPEDDALCFLRMDDYIRVNTG